MDFPNSGRRLRALRYWLVSTADFQNRLLETDDANNWAAVRIRISGSTVTRLEARFPS